MGPKVSPVVHDTVFVRAAVIYGKRSATQKLYYCCTDWAWTVHLTFIYTVQFLTERYPKTWGFQLVQNAWGWEHIRIALLEVCTTHMKRRNISAADTDIRPHVSIASGVWKVYDENAENSRARVARAYSAGQVCGVLQTGVWLMKAMLLWARYTVLFVGVCAVLTPVLLQLLSSWLSEAVTDTEPKSPARLSVKPFSHRDIRANITVNHV